MKQQTALLTLAALKFMMDKTPGEVEVFDILTPTK